MKCNPENDGRKYDHHTFQLMRMQAIKAVQGGRVQPSRPKPMALTARTSTAGWPTTSAADRRRDWPNPSLDTLQNYPINR